MRIPAEKRGVSTAENGVMRGCGENPTGRQKENLQRRKQLILYRGLRNVNNPRVLLKQKEKAFFLLSREILAHLELDFRIVFEIQVGHIHRNEEGEKEKKQAISAVQLHKRPSSGQKKTMMEP